jgi:protein TonB
MSKSNKRYWVVSVFLGSLLNLGLFVLLPNLGQSKPTPPEPVIVVDFMQWQEPVEKPADKPQPPKKNPTPKPKPKPKPKKKKQTKPKLEKKPKLVPIKKPKQPKPEKPLEIKKPLLTETEQPPELQAPQDMPEPIKTIEEPMPEPTPLFQLTTLPRYVHKVTPVYPPVMQAQGREAIVKLEALIDKKGVVRKVTVSKSAGDLFDQAAIAAIKASIFLPGNVDGKPVAVLMRLPVTFRLR